MVTQFRHSVDTGWPGAGRSCRSGLTGNSVSSFHAWQQAKHTMMAVINLNTLLQAAAWGFVSLGALFLLLQYGLGIVFIREDQVGVVIKRFALKNLPPGQIVATRGEAGYQARTLAPGLHFWYWRWQYAIEHTPVVTVPQGELALVVSAAGQPIPPGRILGRLVACDQFQDAEAFLHEGGEKGRQIGVLTAGVYRINPAIFTVITSHTAEQLGMPAAALRLLRVEPDMVGIVTTLDGLPIPDGEIAGPMVPGHDNFQDAQSFLSAGGSRGLQEQILLSGQWNLNPWFAQVEQVPMVEIPIGHVGVVISFVGRAHQDVSGPDFKHGDLVDIGHKGVWVTPLFPGKHPLNTRVMRVELVPTTNIVLNWANRTESHQYDAKLSSITVRSRDGFSFNLDVSQIIHISALEAPKVISRAGSLQNLIDHGLQPIVGNYFRNSAQDYTVLDFLGARSQRQIEAAQHIEDALGEYNVEGVDTLIGDITAPAELMKTQTDRKIAEEQKKTFEMQEAAEKQRQQLVRQTSLADIQHEVVGAEQGVEISKLQADASVRKSQGEAESIRLKAGAEADALRATGDAKASAYAAGVQAVGPDAYTLIQVMQVIGERGVRIVPDVQVSAAHGSATGGLLDGLLSLQLRKAGAEKSAHV